MFKLFVHHPSSITDYCSADQVSDHEQICNQMPVKSILCYNVSTFSVASTVNVLNTKSWKGNARLQHKCCSAGWTHNAGVANHHSDVFNWNVKWNTALRKILITHLISHCTSYAPGGAPGCECEYEREGEGGRDERCLLLQPPSGNGIYFGVKMQMRKTTREEAVSFSSQPMSLCPRRASHNTMGMRGRMKRDQLHVWLFASLSLDSALWLISLE